MPPLNTIAHDQNSKESLELLAAASQFYKCGKIALGVQMILTIGVAVTVAIVTRFYPDFKIWATFIGITIAWLDVCFIDRIQIHYRKKGALAQEALDQKLFALEWNELRAGKALLKEDIHGAAEDFYRRSSDGRLQDWYPPSVAQLPLSLARLVCQRSCLWWETSQRQVYRNWLIGFGTALLICVVILGLCSKMSLEDAILGCYAPIAPALIWAFREARRQADAYESLNRVRNHLEGAWKKALKRELIGEDLDTTTRQLQDALFENRSKNPLIFDWLYMRLRPRKEKAMNVNADSMLLEAQNAGF